MLKLSRFALAFAALALIGAANAPAHAVLTANTLTANGAQATGQSALESLNGVAVEAVILPPETGR